MKSNIPHIGIVGKRNVGKSSFINALADQEISIVSPHKGTTTDPVHKTIELSKLGSIVLTDTAGIDDEGELGLLRVTKTLEAIKRFDLVILLIDDLNLSAPEKKIIDLIEDLHTPYFMIFHKVDMGKPDEEQKLKLEEVYKTEVLSFSSKTKQQLSVIIETMYKYLPEKYLDNQSILGDLIREGDLVLLVSPIDIEAPKGRIILPQVQTIRDVLENNAIVVMLKERELDLFMDKAKKSGLEIALVVTDSQCFLKVDASLPPDIPLTSFSILFSRLKGDFDLFIKGAMAISQIQDGDNILILESCSHHVTGDDIGRIKIPRWISQYTGKNIHFDLVAGLDQISKPIADYSLVVQCGGCMLTRKQVLNRLKQAISAGVPVTNYGMAIAFCHGIFKKAIAPFHLEKNGSIELDENLL